MPAWWSFQSGRGLCFALLRWWVRTPSHCGWQTEEEEPLLTEEKRDYLLTDLVPSAVAEVSSRLWVSSARPGIRPRPPLAAQLQTVPFLKICTGFDGFAEHRSPCHRPRRASRAAPRWYRIDIARQLGRGLILCALLQSQRSNAEAVPLHTPVTGTQACGGQPPTPAPLQDRRGFLKRGTLGAVR